ncbi:MAG: class A beta-lactamase-related serine hydrolase, partial [Pedobacter sp.]
MKYNYLAPLLTFLLSLSILNTHAQQFNTARLDSFFTAVSANSQVMGNVMISKGDKPVYERIVGYSRVDGDKKVPATLKTQYRIGSISKTFTAVMIFQLIEEKKISLDTKLSKFFPQMPNADRITIANLLNHT